MMIWQDIAAKLRRRKFSRPGSSTSRAERIRRQAARLVAFSENPKFDKRGAAALIEFASHGGLRRLADITDPAPAAAMLFERDARDIVKILRHTRSLRDAGILPDSGLMRKPAHSFVRGCLAFLQQDFAKALSAFETCARTMPATRSGATSAEIARFIRKARFQDQFILKSILADAPLRADDRSEPLLLVVDSYYVPDALASALSRHEKLVVLSASADAVKSFAGGPAKIVLVDNAFRTSEQGVRDRAAFDEAAALVAAEIAQHRLFRHTEDTIADIARARALGGWFLAAEAGRLAKAHGVKRVLVVTAWADLYAAVRQTTRKLGGYISHAVWTSHPRIAEDYFSFWPTGAVIDARQQAGSGGKITWRKQSWPVTVPQGATTVCVPLSEASDVTHAMTTLKRRRDDQPVLALAAGPDPLIDALKEAAKSSAGELRVIPAAIFEPSRLRPDLGVETIAMQAALRAWRRQALRSWRPAMAHALFVDLIGETLATAPESETLAGVTVWAANGGGYHAAPISNGRPVPTWLRGLFERDQKAPEVRKPAERPLTATAPALAPAAALAPSTTPAAALAFAPDSAAALAPATAPVSQTQDQPVLKLPDGILSQPEPTVSTASGMVNYKTQPPPLASVRAAICETLIANGKHAERASAALATLWQRGAVRGGIPPEHVLPKLFEDAAFNLLKLRNWSHALAQWQPTSEEAINSDDFAFVRAVVALYRHDFVNANLDFHRYAKAFPSRDSALVAADVAEFLESVPYIDENYRTLLSNRGNFPEMKDYQGKRLLVLSESTPVEVDRFLVDLPADTEVTIVFRFMHDQSYAVPKGRTYLFPDRNEWYSAAGKALHKELEGISEKAAKAIGHALPQFAHSTWALKTQLVDTALFDYRAVHLFAREVATGKYDEVLVATRRYSLYQTAADLAKGHVSSSNIKIGWLSRPGMPAAPGFVYWPAKAILKQRFIRRLFKRNAPQSMRAGVAPALAKPEIANSIAPAVLGWSVGDPNYERALFRIAQTVLRKRPAYVFLTGDDDNSAKRIAAKLNELSREGGFPVQMIRYSSLLAEGRGLKGTISAAARATAAIANQTGKWPWSRKAETTETAFILHDLAQTFARSPHVAAMSAGLTWMDQICRIQIPAYVITAPGRTAFLGSIAEFFGNKGIPTADLHLYFLADQARSMKTPHEFTALVDSQIQDFIQKFWKVPKDSLIRVGYVGAPDVQHDPVESEYPKAEGETLIVCATQPSPSLVSRSFFDDVIEAILRTDGTRLIVKPHPREEESAIHVYEEVIEAKGLSARASVASAKIPIGPLLDAADIVVTRTSNVGLEAASRLKPLVRGLMHDQFLPEAFLNVDYAINTKTSEDLTRAIIDLAVNPAARADLVKKQDAYMKLNPSLVDGLGHERLVDFLETRISGTKTPEV